jgi:hypothetical protein
MPDLGRPSSSMSLRPTSIQEPTIPVAIDLNTVPSELQLVLGLLSLQAQRPYCDGYVLRKQATLPGTSYPIHLRSASDITGLSHQANTNRFGVDGKPCPDQEWYEFFAQLNGTILSLWDAEAVDQAAYMGGQSVMPQFLNITDAVITSVNPQEIPDHQNVLSVSTAGSNRYLFEFQNLNVLKRWSAAFRIATYERAALQECYTAALIARARSAPNVKRIFSAYHGVLGSKGKYSGWVRVRFSWSIKWQKCWVVVSDTPSSWFAGNGGLHERIFYKFSKNQSLRGEARFYQSRRDAKNKPLAILGNVYAAYAVYPEKPVLFDTSTIIKVEGSLRTARGLLRSGEQHKDAFVLLMPDDIPSSTNSNASSPNSSPIIGSSAISSSAPALPSSASRSRFSTSPSSFFSAFHMSPKDTSSAAFESMLTWLVAFYDAFNLYGRPEKLITDAGKADSMIFAMPTSLDDAYLDVETVFVNLAHGGHLEDNTYSSREWRAKLKDMTLAQRKDGGKVFNPAVLLKNAVAEVPMLKQPVPPHLRQAPPVPALPTRAESAPGVRFPPQDQLETPLPPYPPPVANPAQLQQQPRRGLLRRKGSRPEGTHNRDFSGDGAVSARVAMNRFSLNEDSEDEPESLPRVAGPNPYTSSPLRSSDIRPSSSESDDLFDPRVGRPKFVHRMASHRRVQSETRMNQIYREEESTRGYASDEDSEGRLHTRRVSSDEMLKINSGMKPFLGAEQAGAPGLRSSLETGTQFNNRFDPANQRLSESSSDQSELPVDALQDTPRMEGVNGSTSPASSMESLPPMAGKLSSPPRPVRRSMDERLYNAGPAPSETAFNTPLFRDPSQPSVLVPVNGQPIPVRRDGSPPREGPRTAPWSGVPVGVSEYNQDLRTSIPTPPPSSSGPYPPPVVNYPVYPTAPPLQQFGGAPYAPGINDLQMRARGPLPSAYNNPPQRLVARKNVPPPSNGLPPPSIAGAAARSAFARPSIPSHSRSLSPPKSRYLPLSSRPMTTQMT